MLKQILLTFLLLFIITSSFGSTKTGKIIKLRGKVTITDINGKIVMATKDSWVYEGSTIETKKRSIVKILMNDKTKMNIGPKSKIKIENFNSKKKAGVVSLLQGAIRSVVTKNALNDKKNDKNKLYIKTRSAAMGVRGTDFLVTFNQINNITNTITYNGEVLMAAVKNFNNINLDKIVTRINATPIKQGQFSSMNPKVGKKPTLAVKLSPAQFKSMQQNRDLIQSSKKTTPISQTVSVKHARAIAPPGLNVKSVSVNNSSLNNLMGKSIVKEINPQMANSAPPPEGFIDQKSGDIAPPAGGFIDLKTGIYVPPPPGSTFDPNTGVYIPPASIGTFNPTTGEYLPPQNLMLDAGSGEFVVIDKAIDPTAPPPVIPTTLQKIVDSGVIGEAAFDVTDPISTSTIPDDYIEPINQDELEDIAEDTIEDIELEQSTPDSGTTIVTFEINVQ